MKKCSRAIIKINDDYVFVKRIKVKDNNKIEYYTTVGGHLDNDEETFENALKREVYEELGTKCIYNEFVLELYNKDLDKLERFYNVKLEDNNFTHGSGPEFTETNFEKYGSYEIIRINKNKIINYNILPLEIKELLIGKGKNDV